MTNAILFFAKDVSSMISPVSEYRFNKRMLTQESQVYISSKFKGKTVLLQSRVFF